MKNYKNHNINFLLVFGCGILMVIQLFILNKDSTAGESLADMKEQIMTTENENITLSQNIASASAIAAITVKAKEQGFAEGNKTLSVNGPIPIALYLR